MKSNLLGEAPPAVFVLVTCCFLLVLLSRGLFLSEEPPAFLFEEQRRFFVGLSGVGFSSGVRQYNDDMAMLDAIKLTKSLSGSFYLDISVPAVSFASGEKVSIVKKGRQINLFRNGWISSGQRVALGISLHPDQMEQDDWLVLPGIGKSLAHRIEKDRQNNGDFGSLDALARVKGIGKKRIEQWREFF